jgi:hypothetical protein
MQLRQQPAPERLRPAAGKRVGVGRRRLLDRDGGGYLASVNKRQSASRLPSESWEG